MQTFELNPTQEIYSVSRLNNEVRFLLEDTFPYVWVEGEVSNFSAPRSGHWYFCLKDQAAQVNCAMFRNSQRKLNFTPQDGMHLLVKGRVTLYENSGRFQLVIEDMEERGEGKLQRAFELLKKKLQSEGLFDPSHKKLLPIFPTQIGIITSETGAAIRDILTVLKRRYAYASVIVYPTLVQGATAAATIIQAIQTANRRKECDVLILARGGGSIEDLWSFNEECVAQAIFKSDIPIISGIGHEIDFTIADFVSDKRAPTPSAAAELATPDINELLQRLINNKKSILSYIQRLALSLKERLIWIQKHLSQHHPKRQLAEKMQRLDYCEIHLIQLQTKLLSKLSHALKVLDSQLQQRTPVHQIASNDSKVKGYQQTLNHLMNVILNKWQVSLINHAAKLNAFNPLATLSRGYALAMKDDNQLLRFANQVHVGEEIRVRVMRGEILCEVKKILESVDPAVKS